MGNILSHRLFRIYDWWEYKIPQILIPIYLVIINSDYSTNTFNLTKGLQLVFGLILGAITISILGEYFDIKHDNLANKDNGFKNFTSNKTKNILAATIIVNVLFLVFLETNPLIFYLLSILIFFFYYAPFIRLKEKGFFGVIADSLGSHVFPSIYVFLFLISTEYFFKFEYVIFIIWIFLFGIRGILNHQYTDLENDKKSNTNTFVKTSSESTKKIIQKTLLPIELITFSILLFLTVNMYSILVSILIYLLLFFGRKMLYNNAIVYFNIKKDRSFSIFLFEFYTVFFPVLLIIQIYEIKPTFFWLLILFHIIIILKRIFKITQDLKESLKFILQ